jgi:hypothetical protein
MHILALLRDVAEHHYTPECALTILAHDLDFTPTIELGAIEQRVWTTPDESRYRRLQQQPEVEQLARTFLSAEPVAQQQVVRELWEESPETMMKLVRTLIDSLKKCPRCGSVNIKNYGPLIFPPYSCEDCGELFTKEEMRWEASSSGAASLQPSSTTAVDAGESNVIV